MTDSAECFSLDQLYKLLKEHHTFPLRISLCAMLRSVQLPKNSVQRLDYLMKERELLIQIIEDYQAQCRVAHNLTL